MKLFAPAVLAATVTGRSHPPNRGQSCLEANGQDQRGNGLFHKYGRHPIKGPSGTTWINKINTCHFTGVLRSIGIPQMKRAIFFAGEREEKLQKHFAELVHQWAILTGETPYYSEGPLKCGFEGTQQISKHTTKPGWIDHCDWWCGLSNPIESYNQGEMEENGKFVVQSSLNVILQLVKENFARYHEYKDEDADDEDDRFRLEFCERVDHNAPAEYGPGQLKNRFGKKCRNTDKCGQAVRFIYREAAKFESLVEEIPQLSSYQQSWKEDRDH